MNNEDHFISQVMSKAKLFENIYQIRKGFIELLPIIGNKKLEIERRKEEDLRWRNGVKSTLGELEIMKRTGKVAQQLGNSLSSLGLPVDSGTALGAHVVTIRVNALNTQLDERYAELRRL